MGEIDVRPEVLVAPGNITLADQSTAGVTGQIAVSGATLIFYDGSAWKSVSTN